MIGQGKNLLKSRDMINGSASATYGVASETFCPWESQQGGSTGDDYQQGRKKEAL